MTARLVFAPHPDPHAMRSLLVIFALLPVLASATANPPASVSGAAMAAGYRDESLEIRWSTLTPDRLEADVDGAIASSLAEIDAICATPADALSFETVVRALENTTRRMEMMQGKIYHLVDVDSSPARRAAMNAVRPKLDAYDNAVSLNPRLWSVIRAYAASAEAAALPPERRRALDELVSSFRRSGADLDDAAKKRFAALNRELSDLTRRYSENILDATNAWELIVTDETRLAGIPASARDNALRSARAKGLGSEAKPVWRFTLHESSRIPVQLYAENDDLRHAIWKANEDLARVAPRDNRPLIRDIIRLRHEKAVLLGRANFADLMIENRMAKTGAAALAFVESLHDKVLPVFARETADLENYKAVKTGKPAAPLTPWELYHWADKCRAERYAFDAESLRPYFAVSHVESALIATAESLYGVKIRARDTVCRDPATGVSRVIRATGASRIDKPPVEVSAPPVKYFEVYEGGTLVGAYYADWFARDSKRGGAWMQGLVNGVRRPDGTLSPRIGLMCCNYAPPGGDREALLSHREVTTAFHEFGHLLHHLLSDVDLNALAGTNVAWDFVEMPSQLMENWCWSREGLRRIARHHLTGEPPPDALIDKLLASRHYRAASDFMRHLAIAKLDLDYHFRPASALDGDLDTYWNTTLASYQVPTAAPQHSPVTRLGHLFREPVGYAAGYYSYKWSEVLDADAFTRFEKEGLFNPATGKAFRDAVLSKGNTAPPEKLFRDFMGRDPDPDALLRRQRLLPAERKPTR